MATDTLEYYNSNASELRKRYENAKVDRLWLQLDTTFAPKSKILEIGCGSGRDASYMQKIGLDVFALDGSHSLLQQLQKEHPNISGRVCQVILPATLPFADSMFDGIVSIACLMHFATEEIRKIIAEIYRVTKANALFVISIPSGRTDVAEGKDDKGRVFTILPIEEWKNIFTEHSIEITNIITQPDGLGREGIEWVTFTLKKS